MRYPGAILIVERFAPLRSRLLELLAGLSYYDWRRQTVAPGWSVKDITAHLLGGDVAILSGRRDGFRTSPIICGNAELIDLVNRLNAEWIVATRRMSPQLLREFLSVTGPEVEKCFASLDPMATGGPVSWAGPEPAPIWLDLAREFTERWHHQQQIRDATGRPPLYDPYFLQPVLEAFVRALPLTFHDIPAPEGTSVQFRITGEAGGVWYVYRSLDSWTLVLDSPTEPAASVALSEDQAWRLFTRGINREEARSAAMIHGSTDLAEPIFTTTAIIG